MADGDVQFDVGQHGAVQSGQTIGQVQAAQGAQGQPQGETVPTPASLGVTEEQFQKFFKPDTGYNWQAHAKEAEFKLSQGGKQTEPAAPADGGDGQPAPAGDGDAKQAVADAGLDWDEVGAHIAEHGDLSGDQRAKLSAIGIPDEIIDQQVNLHLTNLQNHVENVVNAFGGDQDFESIHAEVKEKMTLDERKEVDRLLNDPEKYQLGVDMVLTRLGRPPVEKGQVVEGPNQAAPATSEAKPFENQDELNLAIANPLWNQNTAEGAAYRAQITERAAKSTYHLNPRTHTSGL